MIMNDQEFNMYRSRLFHNFLSIIIFVDYSAVSFQIVLVVIYTQTDDNVFIFRLILEYMWKMATKNCLYL